MIANKHSAIEKKFWINGINFTSIKESSLLILVALIGFCGFCYLLNAQESSSSLFPNSSIPPSEQASALFAKSCKNKHDEKKPCLNEKESFVSIQGQNKVKQPLEFSLLDYQEEVEYIFNFGNGHQEKLNKPSFEYAYPSSGKYELSLSVSYQGETQVIFNDEIDIVL